MIAVADAPPSRARSAAGLLPGPAVLNGVRWEDYLRFRDDPANGRLRLTYDARTRRLEIGMSLGKRHESVGEILLALVLAYGRVRRTSIKPVGSTTWRRAGAGGAEGDKSFYISNADRVLDFDGNVPDLDGGDLPPDLVIEVDVTSPGVDKLPIYEGVGVPEVWVWEDDAIAVRRLTPDGYRVVTGSVELPGFPLEAAAELVARRAGAATFELEEEFERRLRDA